MPKLTFIDLDDWVAIYADYRLIASGHSVDIKTVLDYLQIEHETIDAYEIEGITNEWFDFGRLDEALALIEEMESR